MEENFISYLQKSPKSIFHFMNVVSFPFNFKFFVIIISILFYEDMITSNQFLFFLIAQVFNILLKYLIRRDRPFRCNNNIKNHEKLMIDHYSFPSGHALNAFLLFYILRDNQIITNVFKIIPYLVMISRVVLGVHYPTDVIAGAIIAKILVTIFNQMQF